MSSRRIRFARILSGFGGTVGVGVAFLGLRLLIGLVPAGLPRFDEVVLDGRVLLFAAVLTAVSGMIFGSLPALHSSRVDLSTALKAGSRGSGESGTRRRFRDALVAAGIVLVMRTFPNPEKYGSAEARLSYLDTLRERLAALPGVTSVGAATGLPLNAFNNTPTRPYWREGTPTLAENAAEADITMVTEGFFPTMGVPLVSGRDFAARDSLDAAPVVIVNRPLARSL